MDSKKKRNEVKVWIFTQVLFGIGQATFSRWAWDENRRVLTRRRTPLCGKSSCFRATEDGSVRRCT